MLYPFVCACQTTCPLAIQPGLLIELLIDGKANTRDIFFPNAVGGHTISPDDMARINLQENARNSGFGDQYLGASQGRGKSNLWEGMHNNPGDA